MAQFKAFAEGVEVNGETVLSVVAGGTIREMALSILAENGIKDPKPGQWYSQQSWLDAFKYISDEIGADTLFTIGLKIPENANFPPDINSIEKGLSCIDVAYHMNHRGGEIGHYTFKLVDEKSGKMICNNPYPCDFDRGIITAMAIRFKPKDSLAVFVDHAEDGPCRKKGDDTCTYNITW